MARKPSNISILQFDERVICRLQVRPAAKGLHVTGLNCEQGDWPLEDGALASALKSFVHSRQVHRDRVFTVLPRHEMTTRILRLPTHDEEEARNMARLSAEEHVPYSLHELVLDACLLQRYPDGYASVLAVYAHRGVVDEHVALLHGAGIEPEQILVSSACIASALLAADLAEAERYALVNLSAGGFEVLVMRDNRLVYDRGVAMPMVEGGPDAETVEELALEVRATLAAYRRESEDGQGVSQVYLASEWTDADALCEPLGERIGYPCQPARFARRLVTRGSENLSATPLSLLGGAMAAQGRAAVRINLVPEALVRARRMAQLKRRLAQAAAAAGVVLCALGLVYLQGVLQRTAYRNELRARVNALQQEVETVSEMEAQLALIAGHVDRSGTALDLLGELSEQAPRSDLSVTQFTYRRGEEIRVRGRTRWQEAAYNLSNNLRSSGLREFSQAGTGAFGTETEYAEPVITFEIIMPIPQEPDDDDEAIAEPAY